MSKKRDYWVYVRDIQNSIDDIDLFVKGYSLEEFRLDKKTVYAVVRAFEIIGEAVKKIPADIRRKYKDIPWREMAGMRDILIHEYFGVDINVIWKTIQKDLPALKIAINKLLCNSKNKAD